MAITESFKYEVPYIHQCNNTTLNIVRTGIYPYPPPDNDPTVKKAVDPYKILGNAQCGITSVGMLCNYWFNLTGKSLYDSKNLIGLYATYDSLFKNGETKKSNFEGSDLYPNIVKSIFQSKQIEKATAPFNYQYIHESDKPETYLLDKLDTCGPIIVATRLTDFGHYVLIIGYDVKTKSYIVNDPFYTYDFTKNKYVAGLGQEKLYPAENFIKKVTENKKGVRMFYVKSLLL